MRFAGYEFDRDNRIGGAKNAISHVNFMSGAKPCNNVTVSGNVFDKSYAAMFVGGYPNSTEKNTANDGISLNTGTSSDSIDEIHPDRDVKGPIVSGNTWIQGYDRYSELAYIWNTEDPQHLGASSQAEMNANISKLDPNAVDVIFYK
jgi:hypothetical protein